MQPGKVMYSLFNDKIRQEAEMMSWLDTVEEDIHEEEAAGRVKVADTLDEIVKWISCDPQTLKNTVAKYNNHCQNKYDAEFLKDPKYLLPLTTPPYYAIRSYSGIDTCIFGKCFTVVFLILGIAAGLLCFGTETEAKWWDKFGEPKYGGSFSMAVLMFGNTFDPYMPFMTTSISIFQAR